MSSRLDAGVAKEVRRRGSHLPGEEVAKRNCNTRSDSCGLRLDGFAEFVCLYCAGRESVLDFRSIRGPEIDGTNNKKRWSTQLVLTGESRSLLLFFSLLIFSHSLEVYAVQPQHSNAE